MFWLCFPESFDASVFQNHREVIITFLILQKNSPHIHIFMSINTCSELPVCPLTTHKHRYSKPRPNACVGGNTDSFFLSWVIIRCQENLLTSLRSLVPPDFTMCKNCTAFSLTEERPGFHQGKFKCFSPLGRSTWMLNMFFFNKSPRCFSLFPKAIYTTWRKTGFRRFSCRLLFPYFAVGVESRVLHIADKCFTSGLYIR